MGLRTERWVTARQKVDEESYLSHLGRKARNMAVFVALEPRPDVLPRATERVTASLGTPCSGSPVFGPPCEWGWAGHPPKPSRSQTRQLMALAHLCYMPLNVHTNSLFSLKHTYKKTLCRHCKRKGRVTCGKHRYS